jgi:NTP pyrophosphatase (non-canonical NTP hydrolase)
MKSDELFGTTDPDGFFALPRRKAFLLFKLIEESGELTNETAMFLNREDDRSNEEDLIFEAADVFNTIALLVHKHWGDKFFDAVQTKRDRIVDRYKGDTDEEIQS